MWEDLEDHTPEQPSQDYSYSRPGYTASQPQSYQSESSNKSYPKKNWTPGFGKDGKPMRKLWQEKDIDITGVHLYQPIAVAFNKECPIDSSTIQPVIDRLNELHFTVRAGGDGVPLTDHFEREVHNLELHLPWKNFNDKNSIHTFNPDNAFFIAKLYMPTYESMKDGVKPILARNSRLVMGAKMNSPILFLITWTPDGVEHSRDKSMKTGTSAHVISIASALRVPIFNLARPDAIARILAYLA